MNDFSSTGLKPEILKAIEALGFTKPTPIQAQSIPVLIEGNRDLVGFAATGTGKTAAFSLPIIHKIDPKNESVQAIILCPTRELCLQITNDIKDYTQFMPNISTVAVYGGEAMDKQIRLLKKGAHIVVGTPGRVHDMLRRKVLKIGEVSWVVLDEADEMLSMGFKEEMEFILEYAPAERQTLMFSATMPKEIQSIAKTFMNDPLHVKVQNDNTSALNVSHDYYLVKAKDKYTALRRLADINPNIFAIVFCRTREDTKQIAAKLIEDGYNADSLHGDLSQAQRDLVMQRFRSNHLQILVATDVAARGIDVDDLTHVINMELPENVETYIHRSGRTGRAGKTGTSVCILHIKELKRLSFFEKKTGKEFQKKSVPNGKEICEKRLFHLIEAVEKVDTSDGRIEPFMDVIYKKLSWMSREELIKNFVALEFQQLLEHYRNADDVNLTEKEGRAGRATKEPKEYGGANDREKTKRNGSAENGFVRFYMNIGKAQKINPGRIIELLNSVKELRNANVGKIFLEDQYCSFDIESGYEEALMTQFRSKQVSGIFVKVTKELPAFVSKFSGKKSGNSEFNSKFEGKKKKKKY